MLLSVSIRYSTDMESRLVFAGRVEGGSGIDGEFGVSRCKLLHLEWISNEVLLYSTGNYVQSLGLEHGGREYEKKECVYIYVYVYIYTYMHIHTHIYVYDWVIFLYGIN